MQIKITWAQMAIAAALGYAFYKGKVEVKLSK